jgi:hypothetical protein
VDSGNRSTGGSDVFGNSYVKGHDMNFSLLEVALDPETRIIVGEKYEILESLTLDPDA